MLTASQKYGILSQKDYMTLEGQKVVSVLTGEDILKHVSVDDFVMSMRSFQGGLEHSSVDGKISSAYVMIHPIDDSVVPSYYKYLFKSDDYIQALQSTSNLVRDGQALRYANFVQIYLPLPSKEEQLKIGTYLDTRTEEIDSLIEQTERSIELLEEYRKSVISEAVTKGLDPDVPMKDSGIEWIQEIPSNWLAIPLKRFFSFGKGLLITKDALVDEGMPVLSYGQIHSKANKSTYISGSLIRYVSISYEDKIASWANKDDLIVADTSEDVEGSGNFARVDKDQGLFAGYHTILLKAQRPEYSHYFSYLMQTDAWRSQIRKRVNGVKLFSLTKRILSSTSLLLPELNACRSICQYLDSTTKAIDCILEDKKCYIEKLHELRKSLISEAVTGKFKVPGVEQS